MSTSIRNEHGTTVITVEHSFSLTQPGLKLVREKIAAMALLFDIDRSEVQIDYRGRAIGRDDLDVWNGHFQVSALAQKRITVESSEMPSGKATLTPSQGVFYLRARII